jgi:5-methylcytosine-specific restriction endonuclease McrA
MKAVEVVVKQKKGRYIKKAIREKLLKEKFCFYCSIELNGTSRTYHRRNLEYDHLRPYSKGGESSEDNIVAACASCNRSKSNKTVFQFERKKFDQPRCQAIMKDGKRCKGDVKQGNKKYCGLHEKRRKPKKSASGSMRKQSG